jgi:type I restriction enzyme R subunit
MNNVLAHTDNDIPDELKEKDVAKAFYGLSLELLDEKIQDKVVKTQISVQTALQIDELIKHAVLENNNPIIDWQFKTNITGKLQIEIGDYLIDDVRDKYNISLSFGEMDEIANKCIEVAKLRYK